jgi:hypothetical protein
VADDHGGRDVHDAGVSEGWVLRHQAGAQAQGTAKRIDESPACALWIIDMSTSTDRLVVESHAREFLHALSDARKQHPNDAGLLRLETEAERLSEDMTNGDWARVGALAGLLWYKLDVVIRHLADIASNTARATR